MTEDFETVPLFVRSAGDGQPLLILHGLFGSGMNWNRIARELEGHYQVHLVDLRNHGQSPHHPDMRYPVMAADVLRVMNVHGLQEAIVMGHSMGGKVAMQLALAHGDRVKGLLVADMAPVGYEGDGHGRLISAMRRLDLTRLGSRQRASHALEPDVPEVGIRQFLLTNLVQHDGVWRWRIPLDILGDSLASIRSWPSTSARFTKPALFVHGAESDYVTPENASEIRRLFPGAQIRAMAQCGHWLHAEDPATFVRIIREFLDVSAR